ncbi:hypothetical protein [Acidovorax sp. BLS4]|nr:hypothetical protein [Paracidovorax avenae]WOI47249.1 hypothetical protein R1Z03_08615 [Paracidovorax avenae]
MKNEAGTTAGFFSPGPPGTHVLPVCQSTAFQQAKNQRIANAMNSHL